MTAVTVAERLTVARLAWVMGLRAARRVLAWPVRQIADLSSRGPRALAIAPQDIRTTDPAIADDIYAGHFHFAGRIVDSHGTSPFDFTEVPLEWETALMGFAWLRHLRAAETALARANARSLIDEWITRQSRQSGGIAWQPQVAARRLISWLSHSPLPLEGFMKSIGRHVTFLSRQVADGLDGEAKLTAVLALMQASLCATGLESSRRKYEKLLVNTLQAQVLPDGAHISRNPQVLVDLLLDLLPLRQAFTARGLSIPQELISCVDRVLPMLRMMRHGDATLALFNGMGVTAPDTLATVLAYDDARGQPVMNAHYAGYQRLEGDNTIVVCDATTAALFDASPCRRAVFRNVEPGPAHHCQLRRALADARRAARSRAPDGRPFHPHGGRHVLLPFCEWWHRPRRLRRCHHRRPVPGRDPPGR